jgi:hypothetical protein
MSKISHCVKNEFSKVRFKEGDESTRKQTICYSVGSTIPS